MGRGDDSAQTASFAQATPEQARATAGTHLREVLKSIAKSKPMIPTIAPDLVPIHVQLLNGQVTSPNPKGQGSWSDPSLHVIGEDVAHHQPGPWYQELGFAAAELALFVVADIATGGLAGMAMAVGSALLSYEQYQVLAAAAKTNVKTDTALVNGDQVDAAAVEAIIAGALAILAVAGVAGKFVKGGLAEEAQAAARADAALNELPPALANKGTRITHTPRPQALHELLEEARQGNIAIHTDDEANRLLDWSAKAAGEAPENFHAVTMGDDIFVRPQYAGDVRILREELIHVFQQRAGMATNEVVEREIEARLMMINFRHTWSITNDEVREMIREIRIMRTTGRY